MRVLPVVLIACLLLAAPAAAQAPHPLTGEGANMELVGNLPLDASDVAASDIEMHGNHAFIGSYSEGMVIADISDPTKPVRAGTFECGGGSQYDVQLSNDGNLALLSTDSTGASCLESGESGSIIVDTTDKANPKKLGFIPIEVGTHTHTLDDRTLYVNNYPTGYSRLEIFDLTHPSAPVKVGELGFEGEDSIHDSFVDHRPDGRTLLYAASIGYTDVIDVTDRTKPELLQRIADASVTISHQAEPNAARDTLIVTDEFQGGAETPACGRSDIGLPGVNLPEIGNPGDTGAMHFYKLAPDGTIADNGAKYGTFNLPFTVKPEQSGCTVHVFWQAPDENRLVTAWYGRGIRVVDFSDPAAATELGFFIPTGADTWSAKPHNGYIFTGDIKRGMDVLRFTGPGWPATAGPQEVQRAAYRTGGKPVDPSQPPAGGGGDRAVGGARIKTRVRVPGKRGRKVVLSATFRNAKGIAAKLRFRKKAGRRRLTLLLAGEPGRYRYTIRRGASGRILRRGTVRVSKKKATRLRVAGDQTLVCRVR